ncbi:hypothetical protein HELRODRAFT_148308, partial [Helobdella robusta]|uniref:Fork-head domain-containing protein n=1 Tax=Helobdella robusta TaxID=6412 RepID=T1EK71_HELRO
KPILSYANLIIMAIESNSDLQMTLSDIYAWIQDTYPYYKHTSIGWKNSIRHNLSLNKCFIRLDRPKENPGKV